MYTKWKELFFFASESKLRHIYYYPHVKSWRFVTDINWQSISIYGDFVTSLTAYYSCADIRSQYSHENKAMSKKVCTYNKNLIPDENLPPNKSRDLLQS